MSKALLLVRGKKTKGRFPSLAFFLYARYFSKGIAWIPIWSSLQRWHSHCCSHFMGEGGKAQGGYHLLKVIQLRRDPRAIIFSSQNTLQVKPGKSVSRQLLRQPSWKKKSNHDWEGRTRQSWGGGAECGPSGELKTGEPEARRAEHRARWEEWERTRHL